MGNAENSTKDRDLTISRKLNAPVELVWEAFTNPGHIAQWWGPEGFTNTIHKMDVRPGGEWKLTMHGPDGRDYDNASIFLEIVPMKKIVYEHTSSPHILATITFEAQGEQTLLNWHMLFDSKEDFIYVVETFKADIGLTQNIGRLTEYVKTVNA